MNTESCCISITPGGGGRLAGFSAGIAAAGAGGASGIGSIDT